MTIFILALQWDKNSIDQLSHPHQEEELIKNVTDWSLVSYELEGRKREQKDERNLKGERKKELCNKVK